MEPGTDSRSLDLQCYSNLCSAEASPKEDNTRHGLEAQPTSSSVHKDTGDPSGCRNIVDEEVHTWVMSQQAKNKVVTSNHIRQKAYEIGRQYDQYFKASINWYNKWKKKYNYQEQPEVDALRNRKRAYTAAFKLHAVKRSAELLSISQASLELNVSRRCLQRWKDELDVITSVAEQASNAVYRRPGQGRKVADGTLDLQLVKWVEEAWKEGEQVTSSTIRQKAKEFSQNPEFKASLGWFMKWQKRHNVNLKDRTINSSINKPHQQSSLKLRLLPEGQQSSYSNKATTRKRKRTVDHLVQVENEEEFDRLLLTWLVECWDAADVVTEKMLRDKASQISISPNFRPTKMWSSDWMKKYNVSLKNQTFGVTGDTEGEIVEESQVYDDLTVQDNTSLTPTKEGAEEEAATALASLASEDPGGLEIAEALQKLASAFGLSQNNSSDVTQQLSMFSDHITSTSTTSSGTVTSTLPVVSPPATSYVIEEGVVELGAEDVVSEEIVMDDPVTFDHNSSTEVSNDVVQPEVHVVLTATQTVEKSTVPSLQQYQPSILTNFTSNVPIMNSVAYQTEVTTSSIPTSNSVDTSNMSESILVPIADNEISSDVISSVAMVPDDVIIEESLINNIVEETLDDVVVLSKDGTGEDATIDVSSWSNVSGFIANSKDNETR